MAPTGIAAKRLGSVCGSVAYTIHRALGAKGKDESERESTYAGITSSAKAQGPGSSKQDVWDCNESTPHAAQVAVVDECSMVDQHLLYRILSGTLRTTRLVLVGDAAQLPSVGPGNVLRDMITSRKFPTVSLTQIFRQEDTSDIVKAAHAIYRGQVPSTSMESDFALIPVREEGKILQVVQRLSEKMTKAIASWDENTRGPAPTFQVLSPRHMGIVGVTNLNVELRKLLNPRTEGLGEVKLGKEDAREQDRVMVVKNNYDLGVYNGDIGTILHINRKEKRVQVQIHGTPPMNVDFPLGKAYSHLRLAYACTVHKYQGLEVGTVIMPIILEFGNQLQRNLLYTAITRAKKKVILVGSPAALEKAVLNNKEDLRNTLLVPRLQTEHLLDKPEPVESKPEDVQFTQLMSACASLEEF
jgi:exodeoxyribonuclease V alpha subunit